MDSPDEGAAGLVPFEIRVVVPPSAIPVAANVEYYSQRNCEPLLGLKPRRFLELLRSPHAPEPLRLGKARLVRRDAMLRFLEQLRRSQQRDHHAAERDGAGRLLEELGCVASARPRREGE